jgi:hypothetical protein
MTGSEVHAIASAISERYLSFNPGGAVRFGIEEAVLAVAEILTAADPAIDATNFRTRCFGRET